MQFKNPFKGKEEAKLKADQKEAADYQMSLGLIQGNRIDEAALLEKRNALVQLSQWQQDRNPSMQRLFLNLSASIYNKHEKKLESVEWDKGYVSLLGAKKLVNFIEGLDHNVMLGSWDQKLIILTLRDALAHPLRRYLFQNHKEIGLQLEHAEYIFWLVMNSVEPTYWRGLNDGERRKDKEIIKVNEIINPYFKDDKKGIFGISS